MQAPPSVAAPALTSTLAFATEAGALDAALPLLTTAFASSQLSVRVCTASDPPICYLLVLQAGRHAAGRLLQASDGDCLADQHDCVRQALAGRRAATAAALSEAAVQNSYRELVGLALRQLQVLVSPHARQRRRLFVSCENHLLGFVAVVTSQKKRGLCRTSTS